MCSCREGIPGISLLGHPVALLPLPLNGVLKFPSHLTSTCIPSSTSGIAILTIPFTSLHNLSLYLKISDMKSSLANNIRLLIILIELVQPLMDGIDDQWDTAFVKFLPAVFKTLRFKTTKAIRDLSHDVDQRMQCNMTKSARWKLRVQMEDQIERICELFEQMKATLIGNDTRGKMRKQLESAMKHEMSRTWKECVETIGKSSPSPTRKCCMSKNLN